MEAPNEDAWDAWSPEQLAERLSVSNVHWYIVGGWALDLFLGAQSRSHRDLEFAVSPTDAKQVSVHLSELTFYIAAQGQLTRWDDQSPISSDIWQFWGADMTAGRWRVDMMMVRGTSDQWVYKRDKSIRQSRAKAIRTSGDGIRYLAPANVLLFKAKHRRTEDDGDFQTVLPRLSEEDRANLSLWLRSNHPGHAWLAELGS